jgi:hypothetical protein
VLLIWSTAATISSTSSSELDASVTDERLARSMSFLNFGYGCAPLMKYPLITKAGVPLMPASLAAFSSASISALCELVSSAVLNLSMLRPSSCA